MFDGSPVARGLYVSAPWQTTAVGIVYLISRRQEINKNTWGHSGSGDATRYTGTAELYQPFDSRFVLMKNIIKH